MKIKLSFFFLLAILFFNIENANSQKIWKKIQKTSATFQQKEVYQKKHFPSEYEVVSLDVTTLSSNLQQKTASKFKVVELPNSDGTLSKFKIKETSNFEAGLQAKFPNIKSYSAQGIDDPTAIAKISTGTDGFHAVIYSGKEETVYVDPYTKDNTDYIVYKRSSLHKQENDFTCQVEDSYKEEATVTTSSKNADDGVLRTYRLALACSAEYAEFHLGASQQNVADNATDAVKKAAVLSAMNTSVTRLNAVYERDLSVRLILVDDNDKIIFLDSDTDGLTDGNPDAMYNEIQSICDINIGNANYDIGHVFSIGGDGVAGLGVVCVTGQKGRGVTGRAAPVGDAYDIDYVAHEMGHQFGATHTQHNDCNRTQATAVEPGSASTIMGYAGICAPNVQEGNANGNSDDYFHAVSIAQMWSHIQNSGGCATLSDTNNAAPTANAGADYSIPKSTPFKLTGSATDADGVSSLTYNWEELDYEILSGGELPSTLSSVNKEGPLFRSLPSKDSPVRYLPDLSTVVAGKTSSEWEVLPSVSRGLNFSFLVRDNNVGGGSTARDDMLVEVVNAEPFTVTSQETEDSFISGETMTVSWNKGTTDTSPIDCQNVNIRLSTDGGLTFPILLKTSTPNDGAEDIIVPDNATTEARIMVEAADNIFYNVNATNFTILSSTPTFLIKDETGEQVVCNSNSETASYTLDFNFINNFTETATLTATGNPAGSIVTFSQNTINQDGSVVVTVSNLDALQADSYSINIVGTSTTVSQNIDLVLRLNSSVFGDLTLLSPVNNATGVYLTEVLSWYKDDNATSYDVEIASDSNFTTIVSSGNVEENKYTVSNLIGETKYFWRVKPKNDCGEGGFSDSFSFTTELPEYCTSTFTDESGGTEHITNVTFNTIDNDSSNDLIDGYEDFTSIETNVIRGDVHQISVTFDTGDYRDYCSVFIDWNKDYVFDEETERYYLGSVEDSNLANGVTEEATTTFNITVPENASMGSTVMRVIIQYFDDSNPLVEGACDIDHATEWGETEDYTINVVGATMINPNNFSVLTTSESCVGENDGSISVAMTQSEFSYQISVSGPSTNINQTLSSASYEISDLEPGNYEVCLFVKELDYTQCFEVVIEESEEIALKVSNKNADIYSFKVDSGTPPYEVYLNNELITISDTKDFDLKVEKSGVLEVKTSKDCEGFYRTSIGDVVLKRNPVIDSIDLLLPINSANTTVNAIIYDINGKLIFNKLLTTENNNLSIPFKGYASGIYILKLSLENSKPIKIIK